MEFTEKDVKRASMVILVALLAVLAFLIVRPVIMSVIGGLILAYIFYPIHKRIRNKVKYDTLSALIVTILVLTIIFLPLWFLAPVMIEKTFELFQASQNFDVEGILSNVFPTDSEQLLNQIRLAITNAVGKISSFVLNAIVDFLIDFAVIALHLLLTAFVFFFALKDEVKLRKFATGLFPLSKNQEKSLIKQFKDITNSIVYGQIIVGLFQGIFAAIGFLIFGVPNAFILSVFALIVSIIPVIGPSLIYIPVTFYLIITGSPFLAIGYLLYNLLIVSSIDNILRSHLVSMKTQLNQVIILVGMIGGLLIFGPLGLILGPLILAYFLTFLEAYKSKTLSSFFSSG